MQKRTPLFRFDAWINTRGVSEVLRGVRTENKHGTNAGKERGRGRSERKQMLEGKNGVHKNMKKREFNRDLGSCFEPFV